MGLIVEDTSIERAKASRIEMLNQKPPSFSDYRRMNDTAMIPDKGFVKQLKTLNKDFEVVWDWGSARWEIWNFPKELGKTPYHVTTIQTQNKSYRELGADVLLNLQWGDTTRFSLNELVAYFDEMDNQVRRRKAKDFETKISDITRDTRSFVKVLKGRPIQTPKKKAIERMVTNA